MGFSLYNILKAGILVANGVAILHPQRFLVQYGLDKPDANNPASPHSQAAGLLQAVQYLKVPLIAMNCLIMFIELLAGG